MSHAKPIKAMILAAGRGERMRPLSDLVPKPLLPLLGKPLIEWHIEKLAHAGIKEIIINTAWLENQFPQLLGDGSRWDVRIHYCMEQRDFGHSLGTAGGVANALPLLGDAFWLIAGDIYAPDFQFPAQTVRQFLQSNHLAHMWVIPNPPYHPRGDFGISANGMGLANQSGPDGKLWTYASIALMRPQLFDNFPVTPSTSFLQLLNYGILQQRIKIERYLGRFENIGTPEQLAQVNSYATTRP